jgi:aspartate/methionine/tyrosine aminotransferase
MNRMSTSPQAQPLNQAIANASPAVLAMLSARGRDIYFPKLGILSQSAEARGKEINATIGTALEDDGSAMCLPSLERLVRLPKEDVFPYAPSQGLPEIRAQWARMLLEKNPSLAGKPISQPLVTSALTHGLSMAGYLFCDPGDVLITPDLYWENYDLLFGNACGARLVTFPTFTAGGAFNLDALAAALRAAPGTKAIVSLNFPNNPAGYTPLTGEVERLVALLVERAAAGQRLVVLVDDAYFGLVFEPGVYRESVFAPLCDAHPNLLAVKLDGPTKEDYVWGFRVGFITFGVRGGTPALYAALEAKCAGAIRGNISNCSLPAQSMLLHAWQAAEYAAEKAAKHAVLQARYTRIREILAAHPEYGEAFTALPFNSGYFMCVRPRRVDPEALRQRLLTHYSTGVISLCGIIRLAFSATPIAKLETLFANLYQACRDLGGA